MVEDVHDYESLAVVSHAHALAVAEAVEASYISNCGSMASHDSNKRHCK